MLMGNTWTHHTSAQLVARSLVHREAESPSHTVGDVSALWTTPHRARSLPFPENSPLGSFEQVASRIN